jgi:peptide/nickel transport system permease protein
MKDIKDINEKRKAGLRSTLRRARIIKRVMLIIPAVILSLIILCAIFADLIAPYSPVDNSLTERFLPPFFSEGGSYAHILGTDSLGRDILSRVIHGSRISLSVGLVVTFINSIIAAAVGIISGYFGGHIDSLLMRLCDIIMAIPAMLVMLILATILGPSFVTIVIAMTATGWAMLGRAIRGEVLKLRNADFIAQAYVNGCSPKRIMIRHFFPNVLNTLVVIATMSIPAVIMGEATLSFLGIGFPPPTPSWGAIVNEGRGYIEDAWWISVFPSIAIALLVLTMNYLGDWLRDQMDPMLREI